MLTRANFLGCALFSAAVLPTSTAYAQAYLPEFVLDGARRTLADLPRPGDKAFLNAQRLLRPARAVMVVPYLRKGHFLGLGEGGFGVVMVRGRNGWSDPAFYTIASASFGLQAAMVRELILLVMTDNGVKGLLNDNFKLGAQAGINVAVLGSGMDGALRGPTPPDVVAWSSSSERLPGGLTFDGSEIRSRPTSDTEYYGRAVSHSDIFNGRVYRPGADLLPREMYEWTLG